MNKKQNKTPRILLFIVIGIVAFFVIGIAIGLTRDFIDSRQSHSSVEQTPKSTEALIADIKKMEIVVEDKKSEYYDCVYTSDDFVILEYIQALYEQPEFSFEKDSPEKLSKLIEELANEKCAEVITAYEALIQEYIETGEEIDFRINSTPKSSTAVSFKLFQLKGEAKDKGKFLVTKKEVLREL